MNVPPGARGGVAYFDDSFMNPKQGAALGMRTVLVRAETLEAEGRSEKDLDVFDCVCDKVVNGEDLRRGAPWL